MWLQAGALHGSPRRARIDGSAIASLSREACGLQVKRSCQEESDPTPPKNY